MPSITSSTYLLYLIMAHAAGSSSLSTRVGLDVKLCVRIGTAVLHLLGGFQTIVQGESC